MRAAEFKHLRFGDRVRCTGQIPPQRRGVPVTRYPESTDGKQKAGPPVGSKGLCKSYDYTRGGAFPGIAYDPHLGGRVLVEWLVKKVEGDGYEMWTGGYGIGIEPGTAGTGPFFWVYIEDCGLIELHKSRT